MTHEPRAGRPARIEQVFIWQTDPTWLRPSAQQAWKTVISSTCFAISGYQSDTQIPLWPYCLKVRNDGINELLPVPMAVIGWPNDSGIGLPASFTSSGFGSKRSMWLGPPSIKHQITDFAVGLKCGGFGASGSRSGAASAASIEESAI